MTQSYTYIGEEERYYSTLGITATTGLIVELEAAPEDGFWEPTPTPEGAAE
jgi:hypothetical protein